MKYYKHKYYGTFAVTIPQSHWVAEDGGGGHRVTDPPKRCKVSLMIDIDGIVRELGPRAAKVKGGRGKFIGGAIIVEVREG